LGAALPLRTALVVALACGLMAPASARVLVTRDEALRQIYGAGAAFHARTAYPTAQQMERVRREARAPIAGRRVTWYEATDEDSLLGVAFVDQHVVRTMSETVLIALDARGRVKAVEILVWNEPEDYLPRKRWLERARGLSDPARARAGEAMPTLAGATLSARAVSAAVRRALAYHRVLVAGGRPAR
jgi:hypothetical protein